MGFLSSILGWWKRRRPGHQPSPYVTETAFRENFAKQATMSPETIIQLRKLGVTDDTVLKLEFFFYTDAEAKAQRLAESLRGLDYQAESEPSVGDRDRYVVTGWTTPIKMGENAVVAWTDRMCRLGYDHDCEFDGWGTYCDFEGWGTYPEQGRAKLSSMRALRKKLLGSERDAGLDLLGQGLTLLDSGDHDRALTACTQALDVGQGDKELTANAYSLRGMAHFGKGQWQQAAADFTLALECDPGLAETYASRGSAHLQLGEYDRAIADCSEALRLKYRFAGVYLVRGNALFHKGEYDRAIADFSEVLRLEPTSAEAFSNRASAYAGKGECAKAIADCNEALQLNPQSDHAYFTRGTAHARMGDYHRAIEDDSEAIRLNPTKASPYYSNRAVHRAELGDYGRTLADLSEALRLDPSNANAYNNAAWYLATCPDSALRDGTKAVAYAIKACELTAWKKPNFLGSLAAAYAEAGEFAEAIKWQKKAMEFPDYAAKHGDQARSARIIQGRETISAELAIGACSPC